MAFRNAVEIGRHVHVLGDTGDDQRICPASVVTAPSSEVETVIGYGSHRRAVAAIGNCLSRLACRCAAGACGEGNSESLRLEV